MFNLLIFLAFLGREQPPSGGCVLKQLVLSKRIQQCPAAAFGRLCVETDKAGKYYNLDPAAAFGRLCVETAWLHFMVSALLAATFGWLCVETQQKHII